MGAIRQHFHRNSVLNGCSMYSGYFEKTSFFKDAKTNPGEISFYDSNTGKLLFTAPKGRTMDEFLAESRAHGWPSFRGKYCALMSSKSCSVVHD